MKINNGFSKQPAFLVAVLSTKVNKDVQPSNAGDVKLPTNEVLLRSSESEMASVVDAVLHHVRRSNDLVNRYVVMKGPSCGLFSSSLSFHTFLAVLNFMPFARLAISCP